MKNKQNFINQLTAILPDNQLLHQAEDLKPYECDALSAYQRVPLAVAIPDNIKQIKAILTLCYDNNVPEIGRAHV